MSDGDTNRDVTCLQSVLVSFGEVAELTALDTRLADMRSVLAEPPSAS